MQLPSIPSANITGSGPVIRSSTPPGVISGSVPSTTSSPSTPSSAADAAPARNQSGSEARQPAPASNAADAGPQGRGDNRVDPSSSNRESRGDPATGENGPESEDTPRNPSEGESASGEDGLSPEKQSAVNQLRARDREVRQHEQAHQTIGGQHAGGATYDYQRGPDGQLYATGGQVSIDTSEVRDDPRATINKMQTVRAAALAPAEPSPQDIQVAQEATSKMLAAQAELRAERREEINKEADDGAPDSGGTDPESGENDSRIALFQDIDRFSDTPSASEASPRFEAIA